MRASVGCACKRVWCFQTRILASGMSGAQICCFAAAVLLLLMRWLSGPAEKLPLRVAEGMTKSGECVRALVARPGVCGAFKRAYSHVGCMAL